MPPEDPPGQPTPPRQEYRPVREYDTGADTSMRTLAIAAVAIAVVVMGGVWVAWALALSAAWACWASAWGAGVSGGGASLSVSVPAASLVIASPTPGTCMPPGFAGLMRSGRLSGAMTGTVAA
jgi:hypothetical protein